MLGDVSENQCDRLSAGQVLTVPILFTKRYENKVQTLSRFGTSCSDTIQSENMNKSVITRRCVDVCEGTATYMDGLIH